MAQVYKFRVGLEGLEETIWRDIEITSVSNVAKLGYSVLAAFESTASHLFCIRFEGVRYEILFEPPEYFDEPVYDPINTKLSSLKLKIGDVLTLEYDYGAGWTFSISLISVEEMKRGTGSHYPYITAGEGKGIIEDVSPYELINIIDETNKTGVIPKVYDVIMGQEIDWDYNNFNLKHVNALFKYQVLCTQNAYECDDYDEYEE